MVAVAVEDRLASLCQEFAQPGKTTVDVPLSQVALATRWQVSASTVNKFIRTCEAKGQIVSRKPLRLDRTTIINDRPVLTLVESSTSRPTETSPQAVANHAEPPNHWVEAIQAALIQAAANGHLDVVLALERRLLAPWSSSGDRPAAPTSQEEARILAAEPKIRASKGASISQSREELERIPSSSLSTDSKTATEGADSRLLQCDADPSFKATALRTLSGLGVGSQIVELVGRRIGEKKLRSQGATPAWLRVDYSPPTWDEGALTRVNEQWSRLSGTELGAHPLLALQLWSPSQAIHAHEVLAESAEVRDSMGQLLEAAVWGYHKYFPVDADTANSSIAFKAEIARVKEIVLSTGHYPTAQSVIDRIRGMAEQSTRQQVLLFMGAHVLSEVVTARELAGLDRVDWSAADIEAEAERIALLLEVV